MKKCVIITTINKPTSAIIKHCSNKNYDTIIVGDTSTPSDYFDLNCIYLDINLQDKLYYKISKLLPRNHYCRKNIGYFYAIDHEYDIIYETDDDTVPLPNFEQYLNQYNNSKINNLLTEIDNQWINIYKYFTDDFIWPRGFPITNIQKKINFLYSSIDIKPSIITGVIDNDPDVDSIFRLIFNKNVSWINNKSIIVSNKNICVFNTQNTFWIDKQIFSLIVLPISVSFRYCDILRSIICNIIMKYSNKYIAYTSPNCIQYRNYHNILNDFIDEYDMFINSNNITENIELGCDYKMDTLDLLKVVYNNLYKCKLIQITDIEFIDLWINFVRSKNDSIKC